jgi:quaternary ammonium compound-resistance protein SugE
MWRSLDDAAKASPWWTPPARAHVVLDPPSVVKRPVVEWADGEVTVGFKPELPSPRGWPDTSTATGTPRTPGDSMNWLILFVAGLFEVAWAIGLKYTDGFTRLWPSVGTVLAMVASVVLLGIAMKTLPVGTAYAVWVGIGAVGTAVLGIVLLGDAANAGRIVSLALIVAGVVGLKLATPT